MKISARLSAIVLSALAAVSTVSCEKPVPEPEDDGEEFRLRNSYGNILVVPSAESISISLKLTNEGGKTLAAEYEGAYRYRYGYNGKFELNEAAVNVDMNQTPTLKVSRDVLNEGELTDQIF